MVEYSKDNTMTRKEYLKSKKKQNFFISKLKYVLLIIVVILLGIYVFKQLNIYNNITKMANKVVEETKLAQTMTMYYVSEPYSREGSNVVMLYKAYDQSRTAIPGTEDFYNLKVAEKKLYGMNDGYLFVVDLTSNVKEQLTGSKIKDYIVKENMIYLQLEDGIYKYDITSKKTDKIIEGNSDNLLVDNNNIYVIAAGKTKKSIIKYNLNGESKKQISDKYIVTSMYLGENDIYFVNSEDSKIYVVSKNGGDIKKVSDNKTISKNGIVCYNRYSYKEQIIPRINLIKNITKEMYYDK